LENKFGDALTSLEESLPKTFYRVLSLEAIQKLEAKSEEQQQQLQNMKQTSKRWRVKDNRHGSHSERTGKDYETIKEVTDRDFYMSPNEAVEYGLIDLVLDKKPIKI
jgi:ATP-dependent protease ClpP protease subunit